MWHSNKKNPFPFGDSTGELNIALLNRKDMNLKICHPSQEVSKKGTTFLWENLNQMSKMHLSKNNLMSTKGCWHLDKSAIQYFEEYATDAI